MLCRKSCADSLDSLSLTLEVLALHPAHWMSQNESLRAGTDGSKLSASHTPERVVVVVVVVVKVKVKVKVNFTQQQATKAQRGKQSFLNLRR